MNRSGRVVLGIVVYAPLHGNLLVLHMQRPIQGLRHEFAPVFLQLWPILPATFVAESIGARSNYLEAEPSFPDSSRHLHERLPALP